MGRHHFSILIVEDDELILKIAVQSFKLVGFDVTGAAEANEALEAVQDREFDAVLSDYKMPGMDGIELLKKLKTDGNKAPFYLMTVDDEVERDDVIEIGADELYIKPFGWDNVAMQIHKFLIVKSGAVY